MQFPCFKYATLQMYIMLMNLRSVIILHITIANIARSGQSVHNQFNNEAVTKQSQRKTNGWMTCATMQKETCSQTGEKLVIKYGLWIFNFYLWRFIETTEEKNLTKTRSSLAILQAH